jgi:hypothetical protein
MNQTLSDEQYYLDEDVIGSVNKYHRPAGHLIRNIAPTNRKKFGNWQEAVVALRLAPCGVCKPFFIELPRPERPRRIGF